MAYHFTVLVEEATGKPQVGRRRPEGMLESSRWRDRRVFLAFEDALQWIIDHGVENLTRYRAITQLHRIPDALPAQPPTTVPDYQGAEVSIAVDEKVQHPRRWRRSGHAESWFWEHRVSCDSHVEAIDWVARNAGTIPLYLIRVVSRVLTPPDGGRLLTAGPHAKSSYHMLNERGDFDRVVRLFFDSVQGDAVMARYFARDEPKRLREHLCSYLSYATGGGSPPDATEMFSSHAHLRVSQEAWERLAALLGEALMRTGFEPAIRGAVRAAVQPMHAPIVTGPVRESERQSVDAGAPRPRAPAEPPGVILGRRLHEPPPPPVGEYRRSAGS